MAQRPSAESRGVSETMHMWTGDGWDGKRPRCTTMPRNELQTRKRSVKVETSTWRMQVLEVRNQGRIDRTTTVQ